MSSTAAFWILVGILILVSRGPLLIWPTETIETYERFLRSGWTRILGLVPLGLGAGLLLLPFGPNAPHALLEALGWIGLAAAIFLLAAPQAFRALALSVFDFSKRRLSRRSLRLVGALAVLIGLTLIGIGLSIV